MLNSIASRGSARSIGDDYSETVSGQGVERVLISDVIADIDWDDVRGTEGEGVKQPQDGLAFVPIEPRLKLENFFPQARTELRMLLQHCIDQRLNMANSFRRNIPKMDRDGKLLPLDKRTRDCAELLLQMGFDRIKQG